MIGVEEVVGEKNDISKKRGYSRRWLVVAVKNPAN